MPTRQQILRNAGQRLFVGFEHPTIPYEFRRFCMEVQPGGFILFSRNVIDPEQVRELNMELAEMLPSGRPAFLCVDQEGGSVQRVRETGWPDMRSLGALGDPDLTREVARAMSRELRAMGFDLNFAPVADVDSNPDNPVIGKRSFSRDPAVVAEQVRAYLDGMHAEHLISCIKHWPGHGDTDLDSHLALPSVDKSAAALRDLELAPFDAALAHGAQTVMTAHVLFPQVDPEVPATMSPALVRDWLREDRGFEGVVFSDDLTMKAVRDNYTLAEQIGRSTEAEVDVFLVGSDLDLQWGVWEQLVKLQEQSPEQAARAERSFQRLHQLRKDVFVDRPPPPPLDCVGSEAFKELAARVVASAPTLA